MALSLRNSRGISTGGRLYGRLKSGDLERDCEEKAETDTWTFPYLFWRIREGDPIAQIVQRAVEKWILQTQSMFEQCE